MRYASINSRVADSLQAGREALEAVELTTDLPWLRDMRTLATVGLADRFGDRRLRDQAVRDFLARQELLFEPHHVFSFGLLDIQEPLREEYQARRRGRREAVPRLVALDGAEVERETGFEPATFCLGSRHSAS
jgi:hypothetical protein